MIRNSDVLMKNDGTYAVSVIKVLGENALITPPIVAHAGATRGGGGLVPISYLESEFHVVYTR